MKREILNKRLSMTTVLGLTAGVLSACTLFPEKLEQAEIKEIVAEDSKIIRAVQEPISGPISLEEAIARTIKYNLDKRVVAMEDALAQADLTAAKMGLIPRIAASSGYNWRDVPDSSHSRTEETGTESTTNTFSEDTLVRDSDLTLTWNVLDFGVGYFQARQAGNRQLVASERRRRVLHNLILQVRAAYWKAVSASLMAANIRIAMASARDALNHLQGVIDRRLGDPGEALRAQKSLIETIAQLDRINVEMIKAKPELAALMGLVPGTKFDVLADPQTTYKAPVIPLRLNAMERIALAFRPELREAEYEVRITLDETKKTFARMFPGIEISFGRNHTTNQFSNHPVWYELGSRVTVNLLNIISAPNRLSATAVGRDIARTRRMAVNLAVLTQVHVAFRDFNSRIRQYDFAKRLWVLDQLIAKNTTQSQANDTESILARLRTRVSEIQAELRFFEAYAVAQNGLGRMYSSLGLDPLPDKITDASVAGISRELGKTFSAWAKGDFPWNKLAEETVGSHNNSKEYESEKHTVEGAPMQTAAPLDRADQGSAEDSGDATDEPQLVLPDSAETEEETSILSFLFGWIGGK